MDFLISIFVFSPLSLFSKFLSFVSRERGNDSVRVKMSLLKILRFLKIEGEEEANRASFALDYLLSSCVKIQ